MSAKQFLRVRSATVAVLPACTYSATALTLTGNAVGALSIDGTAVAAGYVVLVKNQADPINNGIYTVTTAGDGATAFVLTRVEKTNSIVYNSTTTIRTDATIAGSGATIPGTFWVRTTDGTVGVTAWTFVTIS